MKKRRMSFKLDTNEAAVIAPLEFWQHLERNFRYSADEDPESAQEWLDAADHVAEWVERTRDKRDLHG